MEQVLLYIARTFQKCHEGGGSENKIYLLLIAMAIDRETLSIVQFLGLIDRDGISQSQLVICNESSIVSHARGRALNNMAAGMEVTGLN